MRDEGRPDLRVIDGGRGRSATRIVVAPREAAPFTPDVLVVEQDVDLVLAPPKPVIEEPEEHTGRLLLRVLNAPRRSPGTVMPGGGRPLQLLAIVHDLECDPSWRLEWVASATAAVFEFCRRRQVHSLATPLLGTVHGRLPEEQALVTLGGVLATAGEFPRRLWLVAPRDRCKALRARLEADA